MSLRALLQQLEIPVIVAPMFLVSYEELVIATCLSGAIGTMPSLNARSNEAFSMMLHNITQALAHADDAHKIYGINLIVHKSNSRLQDDLNTCIQYKVPIIITSLGVSQEVINAVHSYGGYVLHDVTNIYHAQKAISMGVDGIVAVTQGAGGHAGTLHPFSFVEELRLFYKGVICLAGCINTGRHIKAAQIIGADIAYMGTRFLTATEARNSNEYKQMIIDATAKDIIYTNKISGVYGNFLTESIVNAGIDIASINVEDASLSFNGNKAWKDIWSAGQGVSGITGIETTAAIFDSLKKEYQKDE